MDRRARVSQHHPPPYKGVRPPTETHLATLLPHDLAYGSTLGTASRSPARPAPGAALLVPDPHSGPLTPHAWLEDDAPPNPLSVLLLEGPEQADEEVADPDVDEREVRDAEEGQHLRGDPPAPTLVRYLPSRANASVTTAAKTKAKNCHAALQG